MMISMEGLMFIRSLAYKQVVVLTILGDLMKISILFL